MITKSKITELFGVDGWAKLFAAFNDPGDEQPEKEPTQLSAAHLEDGTEIRAEAWETGKQLFVVIEGIEVPATEKVYTTTSGYIITTDAQGIITQIEMTPDAKTDDSEMKKQVDEILNKINEVQSAHAKEKKALEAELSAVKAETVTQRAAIAKLIAAFDAAIIDNEGKKAPAHTPQAPAKHRAWFKETTKI